MAITLDTIVNKVFKVVKNGYDNNEVEAFLDEILEEMENREAETEQLKAQVANLNRELEQARAQLAARPAAAPVPVAAPVKVNEDRHAAESFELVLSKAKGAYEEIVAAAKRDLIIFGDRFSFRYFANAYHLQIGMKGAEFQTDLLKNLTVFNTCFNFSAAYRTIRIPH